MSKIKIIVFLTVITAAIFIKTIDLQAQDLLQTVSGVVTDQSGDPLIGVTVRVKGTNRGTVSGIDGKYLIQVSKNGFLQFMFVGHVEKEVAVDNQTNIDIVLEDEFSKGVQPAKPIELTENEIEQAAINNRFAFKVFSEISNQEGNNTSFSPLSFNMALGMLYNGSSGETRSEIVDAMGISDVSETEVNRYFRKILQFLPEADPTTDISIANSIWYRNNFSVKHDFIEIGKQYFSADVQALNFNDPGAAAIINHWCAEKTNNRIKGLVGNQLSGEMMMYLINALYFKSQWQGDIKFDKNKTKQADFTIANKRKQKVKMMEQTAYINHYADEFLQSVELDYGNRAFSMVVVLPSKKIAIDSFIEYLDYEKLYSAIDNMRWRKVWLKMPRFKTESNLSLEQTVRKLGMSQIFNGGFENISDDDLWVSDILQKTFVEVNEEGTEAAAATSIMLVGAAGRQKRIKPIRFFADRPFLYLIREKSTGLILFIGRMDEPHE